MPVKHGPKGMRAKVAESRLEPILELETYIAGFRLADEHRADALDQIAKRVGRQLDAARQGRCEFDGCDNDVTMCEDHLEGEACDAARMMKDAEQILLRVVRQRAKKTEGVPERAALRDLGFEP